MRYTTYLLLLLIWHCKSFEADHTVLTSSAAMFEKPDPGSTVVAPLSAGDGLLDLGRVSRFETTFSVDQTETTMPWMEMQNRNGKKGWVWMGWIRPDSGDNDQWVQNKRLLCYLGPVVYKQYQLWQTSASQSTLPVHFQKGVNLRDSIVYVLHHRPDESKSKIIHWDWLTESMLGFVFQRVDQGTRPYLFIDYSYWLKKASESPENPGCNFFQTMCLVYPADSIESFFPVWTIQTDETSGCSQLGLGRHVGMLKSLDQTLQHCPEFEEEVLKTKNLLLEDVLGKEVCYWQIEKKILSELNDILINNFKCLTPRDVMALKARKQMFENPDANGIRVNLRAGE